MLLGEPETKHCSTDQSPTSSMLTLCPSVRFASTEKQCLQELELRIFATLPMLSMGKREMLIFQNHLNFCTSSRTSTFESAHFSMFSLIFNCVSDGEAFFSSTNAHAILSANSICLHSQSGAVQHAWSLQCCGVIELSRSTCEFLSATFD